MRGEFVLFYWQREVIQSIKQGFVQNNYFLMRDEFHFLRIN